MKCFQKVIDSICIVTSHSQFNLSSFYLFFCTPELLVTKAFIFSLDSALAFECLAAFLGTGADRSVIFDSRSIASLFAVDHAALHSSRPYIIIKKVTVL